MGKKTLTREDVAEILDEIGTYLEIKGENPFKCNAYHNAARSLETYDGSLQQLIESGDINQTKGIGKSIAEKIGLLYKTGKLPYLEDLKKSLPAGLLEMLKIPGFGPRKAKAVYDALGISTVGELEYACQENRLVDLPGFGKKSQEKILQGIEFIKKGAGRHHIDEALKAAQEIIEPLKKHQEVINLSLCGSLRRHRETIKDIDILASARNSKKLMDFFVSLKPVERVEVKGETKSSVVLESGINADLRIVSPAQFPYALHYFTGSKEHNVAMRGRAKKEFDIKMNEYGLFKGAKEKLVKCKDEEAVFEALGLAYIPPELREDMGEIEIAEKRQLPTLIEEKDLRGTFHVHTPYSDGVSGIMDYVNAAQKMGLEYVGIADHSKSAAYANGMTEAEIKEQLKEIDQINEQLKGFRVFKGIEVDILANGALDYDDQVLAQFDFVIAAVHSKFKMMEEAMTDRILHALNNKYVTMLGHPTGRLLLARDAYPINLHRVIEFCAKNNVLIEINCHPYRLDLDWRYCKRAIEAGVMLSLNPDAHNIQGLNDLKYGVGVARKGWCQAKDILNTYSIKDTSEILDRRRKKKK